MTMTTESPAQIAKRKNKRYTMLIVGAIVVTLCLFAICAGIPVVLLVVAGGVIRDPSPGIVQPIQAASNASHTWFTDVSSLVDKVADIVHARPAITVNNSVVVEGTQPVQEFAVVKQTIQLKREWSNDHWGSTKALTVQAVAEIKAGFDFKKGFALAANPDSKSATWKIPQPQILSVEISNYSFPVDENGWWNSISKEERAELINQLQGDAKQQAIAKGILADTTRSFESQMSTLSKQYGYACSFKYAANP